MLKRVNQNLDNPSIWIDLVNLIITVIFKIIGIFKPTKPSNDNNQSI